MNTITRHLFATEALRLSAPDTLFWYTSGKLGPLYVNTHFLFGSESEAVALLADIDARESDRAALAAFLSERCEAQYNTNAIYKDTIDALAALINDRFAPHEYDCISGGARRDWFFSIAAAKLLGKRHITLYKDGSAGEYDGREYHALTELCGERCLHIADLITEASSYERAWIPAVHALGGRLFATVVVVNRRQGGFELLDSLGVRAFALADIDDALFAEAEKEGFINGETRKLICDYLDSPDATVKAFLAAHEGYIDRELAKGGKAAERAKLCIEKGFY